MGSGVGHAEAAQKVAATAPGAASALSPMEVSPDPLITIGLDGKVTDLNEAMSGIIGLLMSVMPSSLPAGSPSRNRRAYGARAIANGFVADYPLTIRRDRGSFANLLFNASVYSAGTGQKAGVFPGGPRCVTEGQCGGIAIQKHFSRPRPMRWF